MNRSPLLAILVAFAVLVSACNAPTPTVRPTAAGTPAVVGGPTPTPRPLGNPILVDRAPAQGEELALDKPISLVFDQAMDRASVEQALELRANGALISGARYEWTRDNAVTIVPPTGWETGAAVQVNLADAARSARGLKLARAETFRVNAAGALVVAQTLPGDKTTDVSADSAITVLFNRPVVALSLLDQQANLPQPLTFSPSVEGRGEWLNTSIYVFRPARPLAAGQQYRATVAAGVKDTTGSALKDDFAWTFSVAAPVVKQFAPTQAIDVDLRQPISVTFSQKMDHASAEAAFSISPPMKGAFRWADEAPSQPVEGGDAIVVTAGTPPALQRTGETLGFWPEVAYQRDTAYAVAIRTGALSLSGAGTRSTASYTFRTVANFAAQTTRPADGATNWPPGSGIQIRFTAPPNVATIMPNLRFEPAVSLTRVYSYYNRFDRTFLINAPLEPSSGYALTVGPDVEDIYGQKLGRPTTISFRTAALSPYFSLQTRAQIGTYSAALPTRLFSSYRNVSRLDFALYALTLEEFYQVTGPDRAYEAFRSLIPAAKIREWSVKPEARLNEAGIYRISPEANGGALRPGLYLLIATAPEANPKNPERHILVVSNAHVAVKQGERDTLAWVTDLATGQPVASAPVSIRGQKFDALNPAGARTDADGLVAFASPSALPAYGPIYAIVGQPGEAGFGIGYNRWTSGIEPWDFNLPTRLGEDPLRAYVYTDRPIYRPGQMVYFKGAIRNDDDARYGLTGAPKAVDVNVTNDQGQQVFTSSLTLSAAGAFSGAVTLANTAGTGYYNIVVQESGTSGREAAPGRAVKVYGAVGFQVATYRAPAFEVAVSPDKKDVLDGEIVSATVEARTYFGANVAGAKVEWSLLQRDFAFDRYQGQANYRFEDDDYGDGPGRGPGFNQTIATGVGVTGPDGKLMIRVPADIARRRNSATLTLEASVTDADDMSVSARADVVAHKGTTYYGVATEDYVGVKGGQTRALLVAVDTQGKPLPDTDIQVVLTRREWFTTQIEDASGNREYTSVPRDTPVLTRTARTGVDGRATVEIDLLSGGEFRLIASAPSGSGQRAATSLYVSSASGEYVMWRVNNNDRIEIKADKTAYKVGDTARILVPSPFSGTVTALLTVERGRILTSKVVTLKSNSDILEVPIDASLAPNAYVSVLLVKGAQALDGLPAFKLGYIGFKVDPGQFALTIDIKPDRATYQPREKVTYDIRVTDAGGKPVQAELSLALVDKAILSLSQPNSIGILDYFYGTRGLGIRTASSLAVSVDRVTAQLAKDLGKGGGGGGLASAAEGVFTRENFKDTAYWNAVAQTDADGRVRVEVTLPDNLTTWSLDVRAITMDTKVGQGRNEIVTAKPLLVRPVTPRFFTSGDSATLGAVVNNNTEADIEADVSLEATGARLTGAASQRVTVKARSSARVDWAVVVDDVVVDDVVVDDVAAATLTFSAKGSGYQDTVKPGLATAPGGGIPILRYSAPEYVGTAGDLSEGGKRLELLALPPRIDTGRGTLDLQVDVSLAAASAAGRLALERSVYEDNETTASRLMAALAELSLPGKPADTLRSDAGVSIQRLVDYQLNEGGWCWWRDEQCSPNTTVSAWAYLALARAKRAGLTVDAGALARAEKYARGTLVSVGPATTTRAANLQALVAFALAEGGATNIQPQLNLLFEQREKLGYWARALLAMSIAELNPADSAPRRQATTLMSDLANAGIASATGLSWQEKQTDGYNFASGTRTSAMAILAFARLDPQNPLIPNAVRWLMMARRGETWETSQEIAWSVTALAAWMKASGELDAAYEWRVTLNDDSVLNGQASAATLATPSRLTVEAAGLLRGQANQIGFERGAGPGRMYYTARLNAWLPADSAKAVSRGVSVARKYELADCQPAPGKPCPAVSSAKIGQNIRVRLTLIAPSDLYFVRLSDTFPAGAEAIDSSLKTSAQAARARESDVGFGSAGGWGWWWFGNRDLRDERIDVFADYLPRGTYEYTYLLRAGLAGSFQAIPALVEQRYAPEVFGRSDGALLTIAR